MSDPGAPWADERAQQRQQRSGGKRRAPGSPCDDDCVGGGAAGADCGRDARRGGLLPSVVSAPAPEAGARTPRGGSRLAHTSSMPAQEPPLKQRALAHAPMQPPAHARHPGAHLPPIRTGSSLSVAAAALQAPGAATPPAHTTAMAAALVASSPLQAPLMAAGAHSPHHLAQRPAPLMHHGSLPAAPPLCSPAQSAAASLPMMMSAPAFQGSGDHAAAVAAAAMHDRAGSALCGGPPSGAGPRGAAALRQQQQAQAAQQAAQHELQMQHLQAQQMAEHHQLLAALGSYNFGGGGAPMTCGGSHAGLGPRGAGHGHSHAPFALAAGGCGPSMVAAGGPPVPLAGAGRALSLGRLGSLLDDDPGSLALLWQD
jgi:hypothetical protein